MAVKPLKRHISLQPLSRDHHHSLLLCWKIRQGIDKNAKLQSIQAYCKWYYKHYVLEHFEAEEKHLLNFLNSEDQIKILDEHRTLKALFESKEYSWTLLEQLAGLLEAHIRFEERILFKKIQENSNEELNALSSKIHDTKFVENTENLFWL